MITPRIIASAYHCAVRIGATEPCDHSDRKRIAVLGVHDYELTSEEDPNVQIIPIIDVLYPPNPGLTVEDFMSHDFALFKLEKPAKITEFVSTICLPGVGDRFGGKKAWAAGFGLYSRNSMKPSPVLRKVELTVSSKVYQHTKFFGTELSRNSLGLFKDPCRGDSGMLYHWHSTLCMMLIEGFHFRRPIDVSTSR